MLYQFRQFSKMFCVFLVTVLYYTRYIDGTKDMERTNYFETFFNEPDIDSDQRNAIKWESFKWPNRTVPYIFGDEYNERNKAAVLGAMEIFHKETCVKFVPKTKDHVEHIKYTKSAACGANVGCRRNRNESLDVTYSEYCLKIRGAIQHEMFHVLGLLHEQARPDRDDYIEIFWENIDPRKSWQLALYYIAVYFFRLFNKIYVFLVFDQEYYSNFGKAGSDVVDTFGLPYDYDSLMHYPGNAFAKPNKNVTIVSKVNARNKRIIPVC